MAATMMTPARASTSSAGSHFQTMNRQNVSSAQRNAKYGRAVTDTPFNRR